jgi:hypothetical protein
MKLQTRILAALSAATVAAAALVGVSLAQPANADDPIYIGSAINTRGKVDCYHQWISVVGVVDHTLFCVQYDWAGNLVSEILSASFNYENCDGYQVVDNGWDDPYIDIWNEESPPGLEIIDEHGHRGGCVRGDWQSWDHGIGTSFPEWGNRPTHGALFLRGYAAAQDECGVRLPYTLCPGLGMSLRVYLR